MNFLPAVVSSLTADRLVLQLDPLCGGETLHLRNVWPGLAPGQPVCLGIRPEHMQPGHDPEAGATLSRAVLQVEHFGDCCHVALGGGSAPPLIAKLPDHDTPRPGDVLALTLPAQACHLFDEAGFAIARTAP
jgi:multiple sugar transport system ATP-binding protein